MTLFLCYTSLTNFLMAASGALTTPVLYPKKNMPSTAPSTLLTRVRVIPAILAAKSEKLNFSENTCGCCVVHSTAVITGQLTDISH